MVTRFNDSAALNGNLPTSPLHWQVITSAIDHRDATMYTIFGNDSAIAYARSHDDQNYPARIDSLARDLEPDRSPAGLAA